MVNPENGLPNQQVPHILILQQAPGQFGMQAVGLGNAIQILYVMTMMTAELSKKLAEASVKGDGGGGGGGKIVTAQMVPSGPMPFRNQQG